MEQHAPPASVAAAIGAALARAGVRTVFGVVGSGNFHVTNALTAHGARFVPARHEGAAAVMADAYARVSGELGVVSVHQGPGLTNALTGITEAAKSRTPLLILAAEATSKKSNFYIDQAALATAVGAVPLRLASAGRAELDLTLAYQTAVAQRRTVLLSLPLDVQSEPHPDFSLSQPPEKVHPTAGPRAIERLADALANAERPVFIAGRGARKARQELQDLNERVGALLATSAVSKGLFRGNAFNLDVSGGFATPIAAELIANADLIVAWGCTLNMWTTRHGALVSGGATVIQVDTDPAALAANQPVALGIVADVAQTAQAVRAELDRRDWHPSGARYHAVDVRRRIERERRWRDVPFDPVPEDGRIDPRTLTIALDDLLPAERTVAVDSGNFMGYPAMFLDVPDEDGFVFTQAFQSIGLGLATAIGAAIARQDRMTVAALGDGGALMGASELETVVRLGLTDFVIVVYDDEAYGAEVHHFGPHGHPLDHVVFPPADLAAIARGYGYAAVTVRGAEDLAPVKTWLDGPRDRPLLIDAKVAKTRPSWWLEEAFRGH
jgi:thiamine pyrophosphate-dependent acetolactate synthase large subunit-like protein